LRMEGADGAEVRRATSMSVPATADVADEKLV
jgi:hypothetical protein